MKLYSIPTGNFKLDGGAMFGVVPKSIWQKINPADDNNMCNWAMRCLLVEHKDRLILIDNGIGDKQDDKFFSYYFLNGDDSLSKSLRKHGFHEDDITDVFLTHLHFDHCGGSVKRKASQEGFELCFKKANYWSNEKHWNWATKPNSREKASFLKENILPVEESGQLKFLKEGEKLLEGFDVIFVNGHTEAMMLPVLNYNGRQVIYCADLIPSAGHLPVPYVMAYDTRPLVTLEEKSAFMANAINNNSILFFEHDLLNECGSIQQTERGIKIDKVFPLSELS